MYVCKYKDKMSKKNKTISIEEGVFNLLSSEENASGLIERLLKTHFDLKILEEHRPPTKEELTEKEKQLQEKAKELNLEIEKLQDKKVEALDQEELNKKLSKIGITNPFLIDRLKKSKDKPSIMTAKHLRDEYDLKEALVVWEGWKLLHPEYEEEEDED